MWELYTAGELTLVIVPTEDDPPPEEEPDGSGESGSDGETTPESHENVEAILTTSSRLANLSNPNRFSWSEHR